MIGGNNISPYFILSLNGEKAIAVDDTIVVPLAPNIKIFNIYSQFPNPNNFAYHKVSDEIYALSVDFSKTSMTLEDVYPFFLKIDGKFYIIDHENNCYELFTEKETIKSALSGKQPRSYIENTPLTLDNVMGGKDKSLEYFFFYISFTFFVTYLEKQRL